MAERSDPDSQRAEAIAQGHAQNRMKALPPPGKAPYGYRRGKERYVLDRVAAGVVKEFVEQFLLFGSLRGAVRFVAQRYGKQISVSTGQRWLTHPVYRGDLVYKDGEVVPNTHPAILSRAEAAQIDRLLRRNRRLPPKTASAPRSLAGLVRCGRCQSPMTIAHVTSRNKHKPTYLYVRPVACGQQPKCKAFAYQAVLEQVVQRICQELPQAVAQSAAGGPARLGSVKQGIEAAIARQQGILDQLPELLAQGILDEATAALRTQTLRTELATLRQQLAQLPPINLQATVQAVAIPQFWFDLSEPERRFFFREFIQAIELEWVNTQNFQVQLKFIF